MNSGVRKELLDTQTHSGDSFRPPVAPLPLMPGMVLLDKYEVERVLGVGGMGVVVSAMHLELGERVAIKAMLTEVAASRDHATRFAREAQAAARIKSEFVARVTDVARLPDGTPFMVMEYLEGETLATYLDRHGPLPVETAVDTLLEACVALAEAHRLGIVHRDIKPANLFVARRPSGGDILKVLDFGISKSDENVTITRTSGAMGTPAYMSPEQLRAAGTVRPSADIWSLGVVLFEMLTGELPYQASSFADICALVLVSPPRTPRSFDPAIPQALEDAILRCLQREAADRFPNILALARALAPFASENGCDLIDRVEVIGNSRASLASIDDAPISGRRTFSSLPRITPRSLGVASARAARAANSEAPRAGSLTPTTDASLEPPRSRTTPRIWLGATIGGALLVGATWLAFRQPAVELEAAPSSMQAPSRPAAAPASTTEPTTTTTPASTPANAASSVASSAASASVARASGRPRHDAPASSASAPAPRTSPPPAASGVKFDDFGGRK
jgi:serine/threonine protein kinase